jgi:hypothetical protein
MSGRPTLYKESSFPPPLLSFLSFFFLGDYPASRLKFKPTFRDHYLSRHQGCNCYNSYNPDDAV